MPKLSVITPCYNAAQYIAATIESVRAQTFTDWEHLIIDDGSTDRSAEVISRATASDERLRLISKENGGVASARNAGLAASSPNSSYVLFLDHDDFLEPDALADLTQYLDSHTKAACVYGLFRVIDGAGAAVESDLPNRFGRHRLTVRNNSVTHLLPDEPARFESFLPLNLILSPGQCLIRRRVAMSVGSFDSSLDRCDDWDYWLRLSLQAEVHLLPKTVLAWRLHEANSSRAGDLMFETSERVIQKLLGNPALTPQQRQAVLVGRRFGAYGLQAHFCLRWAGWALRRRAFLPAVRCYVRYVRLRTRYFLDERLHQERGPNAVAWREETVMADCVEHG